MILLMVLWKRASSLRSAVEYRLRNLTSNSNEGTIRLPDEEGPPAEIFNEDEELEDHERRLVENSTSTSTARADQEEFVSKPIQKQHQNQQH
ncbi:hypothetical protein M422DRAFT_255984 [Sphaerobolus stellatus SS14]|uniref:Uncharacterized protein n=1 Tax=Sphaerobolus stellatus (strain SS14) TaxID=990650 RepID=A0A0C9UDH8_SPHS4|nr:hypothetical protein M422DRAFT_255984 [Sphaerobolus stellatus SS14]